MHGASIQRRYVRARKFSLKGWVGVYLANVNSSGGFDAIEYRCTIAQDYTNRGLPRVMALSSRPASTYVPTVCEVGEELDGQARAYCSVSNLTTGISSYARVNDEG